LRINFDDLTKGRVKKDISRRLSVSEITSHFATEETKKKSATCDVAELKRAATALSTFPRRSQQCLRTKVCAAGSAAPANGINNAAG
ncbi:hypothetical protein Trydic_g11231, partial [Trypoxylus dichotomus]